MMKVLLCILAASAFFGATASAATLSATPTEEAEIRFSSFSIEFTDVDNDGLLSLDEINSFSGFADAFLGVSYDMLAGVPDIDLIADGGATSGSTAVWILSNSDPVRTSTLRARFFNYSVSNLEPAVVPLPPTVSLGGFGFAVLMLLKRRRKT